MLEEFFTNVFFSGGKSNGSYTFRHGKKKACFIILKSIQITSKTLEIQVVYLANVVPNPATADVPTWHPLLATPSTMAATWHPPSHQVMGFFVKKTTSNKVTQVFWLLSKMFEICKDDFILCYILEKFRYSSNLFILFHSYSSLPRGN